LLASTSKYAVIGSSSAIFFMKIQNTEIIFMHACFW